MRSHDRHNLRGRHRRPHELQHRGVPDAPLTRVHEHKLGCRPLRVDGWVVAVRGAPLQPQQRPVLRGRGALARLEDQPGVGAHALQRLAQQHGPSVRLNPVLRQCRCALAAALCARVHAALRHLQHHALHLCRIVLRRLLLPRLVRALLRRLAVHRDAHHRPIACHLKTANRVAHPCPRHRH